MEKTVPKFAFTFNLCRCDEDEDDFGVLEEFDEDEDVGLYKLNPIYP